MGSGKRDIGSKSGSLPQDPGDLAADIIMVIGKWPVN